MKKKTLICTLVILLLGTVMIGCGDSKSNDKKSSNDSVKISSETNNNNNNNNDKDKTDKESSNTTNDVNDNISNTTDNSDNPSTENKTFYLSKLDSIEAGLSDLDNYYAGNTIEMTYAAEQEYQRWDNALNEIYNKLKETLPKDEFAKLEKEEIDWIAKKEKDANAAYEAYNGGTGKSLGYYSSAAKSTKDRCYELVNNYM